MYVQDIPKIKFLASPAQSERLQRALFAKGGKWGQSGPVIQKTDRTFLKLRKGALSCVNDAEGGYATWLTKPYRQVSFDEALAAIEACDTPSRRLEVPMSIALEIIADAYDKDVADICLIDG